MQSIQEALQTGKAQKLGPVTIKKDFGSKITSKGSQMRRLVISDGSGETGLTLFEPAAKQSHLDNTTNKNNKL